MWLQHLFSFFGAVVQVFFDAIGTTVLGRVVDLAFAFSVTAAALRSVHRESGWRAMLDHWQSNYKAGVKFVLWCAFIIYSPVILWSIGRAVYQDHVGLIEKARSQRVSAEDQKKLLEAQVVDLRVECAGFDALSKALQNQNRDQQNTINNCQNQALKLLKPEDAKVYFFPVQSVPSNGAKWVVYVAVTNKIMTPAYMEVDCDAPILNPQGYALNSQFMMYGGRMNSDGKGFSFTIASPAFAPNQPVGIQYGYAGDKAPNCEFRTR
ncbi:MAG: hypothetical protein ABSC48_14695 [Terracidiphilus sp.]|jgi:hypothetical protein